MKIIEIEGKTYNGFEEIPDPLKLSVGTISPVTEESLLRYGAVIRDDGKPLTPEQEAFRDSQCCVYFRTLVMDIREETGNDNFMGGYEEWPELKEDFPEVFDKYISLFNAMDNWCKKDAGKHGWGSPEWFYYCWNMTPPKD